VAAVLPRSTSNFAGAIDPWIKIKDCRNSESLSAQDIDGAEECERARHQRQLPGR
jgi:hypothetical protein